MRVLVTGSQLWTDKQIILQELDKLLELFYRNRHEDCDYVFVLVHGHCPKGADAIADEWFKSRQLFNSNVLYVERHPADWKGPRKKGAGYARNVEMIKLGANYCLAFILDESPGSTHCAELAEKAGIETIYFRRSTVSTLVKASKLNPARGYIRVEEEITLRDIRPMWRNFSGEERQFNPKGKRNFAIPLPEEVALALYELGWNIKDNSKKVQAGLAEELLYHLTVNVKMDGKRPPRIFMITKSQNRRTQIDEETVSLLDYAEFERVDVTIRGFNYDINGKQGVSAYLKIFMGTLREDELELEYSHIPIDGQEETIKEIENFIDLQAEEDSGWVADDEDADEIHGGIDARVALPRGK